ncbi:MAG TPA: potassium-transporting ATPase subunit KdpC [Terriglobales bacterium]|jgi:K+-transporting ATPase ATPase C chain|nr:potassium-transporting ATPase subunit KdpC [Terriglobales bacterium]
MKKNLIIAILMTIATTVLLGIIYPLVVTGLAQVLFPRQANGELIAANGKVAGSQLIAQAFTGPGYFHPRPSAVSYDPTNSNGSQLGPTNQKLIDRVNAEVAADHAENPSVPVPVDLVTASASGLDPDITPASAEFQLGSVAKERGATVEQLRALVARYTVGRQFGILGEPRVNVLELNLELDQRFPMKKQVRADYP